MFNSEDEKYLIDELNKQRVILFLGSGFSLGALNLLEENFPTGKVLCEKLWDFLDYEGDYDGTSLTHMYQAFLSEETGNGDKQEFLKKHLTSSEIPDTYDEITRARWRRIYSTNVDDVLEQTFKRNNIAIKEYRYPKDDFPDGEKEKSQPQVIYLHGKLPCDPEEVVFSPRQYAKAQYIHEPLYEQFVHDYAHYPTIFIGTELNEPLFERYIIARERSFDVDEDRPKSFLITPSISPVKADNLRKDYNVHHREGTTEAFLNWLKEHEEQLSFKP